MSKRLELGKQSAVLLVPVSLVFSVATAHACETVDYNLSSSEMRIDAINNFDEEVVAYEGVLLGSHDFEHGGRFLVLKSYKGPAETFDVIELPGGSSCYSGVPIFSMGIATNDLDEWTSFDGLVANQYVDILKERGLVASGVNSPIVLVKSAAVVLLTIIAGLIFFWRRRTRAKKTA